MFKDFELFSSQYTDFIDSGKNYQVHVFVVIHKISKIANFTCNYLKNYNDSEHAVKTKNASFFMIFPNILFFHMIVNYWTGPLSLDRSANFADFSEKCLILRNPIIEVRFSDFETNALGIPS